MSLGNLVGNSNASKQLIKVSEIPRSQNPILLASSVANTIPIVWDGEIVKPSDETVTTDTTLQNDDDFAFPVAINGEYLVEIWALINAPSAGDFKANWTLPASGVSIMSAGGGTAAAAAEDADLLLNGLDGERFYKIWIILQIAGTGGTATFQWAQQAASGSTILRQNSVLRHRRID